jgi:Flp pilus assembly protein TadG
MKTRQAKSDRSTRRGVAAVEAALCTPLLVLIVMGAIDVGQYANVAQTVSNASREGARYASRDTITKKSEVKTAVLNYLQDAYPNLSSSQISSATQVMLKDSSGTDLVDGSTNGALQTVASGSPVTVQVTFQYGAVRWTNWFSYLSGKSLSTTTIMRRE